MTESPTKTIASGADRLRRRRGGWLSLPSSERPASTAAGERRHGGSSGPAWVGRNAAREARALTHLVPRRTAFLGGTGPPALTLQSRADVRKWAGNRGTGRPNVASHSWRRGRRHHAKLVAAARPRRPRVTYATVNLPHAGGTDVAGTCDGSGSAALPTRSCRESRPPQARRGPRPPSGRRCEPVWCAGRPLRGGTRPRSRGSWGSELRSG